ncbi:hypothetical protein JAAARDRAFT_707584 [Jaapia argillacea MUCL 33604]|uniref:RNase H type-1 domain-containing protein n=1 Tax=Jaapia argillacea MUCL 33604 TaxID=933084 RepID=A0A067PAF5_9AGAM|nr:hypothetical protein JAAARDRAFT_707584 [Jaapia argillacea MUCL 33604]
MEGLVSAARDAVTYIHSHPFINHVHIYTNNYAALTSIVEPMTRAGQHRAASFQNMIMNFLDQNAEHTLELGWSPGHEGICSNEKADQLARDTSELWCLDNPTLTHANDWTVKWKSHKFTGAFAPMNQFPPAWKPKDHFFTTKREVYS